MFLLGSGKVAKQLFRLRGDAPVHPGLRDTLQLVEDEAAARDELACFVVTGGHGAEEGQEPSDHGLERAVASILARSSSHRRVASATGIGPY